MPRIRFGLLGHAAVLMPWAVACSSQEPSPLSLLTTDSTRYTSRYLSGEGNYRQYGFSLIARFENRSARVVYLARCTPSYQVPIWGIVLDYPPDPGASAYSPGWACTGHDRQFAVAPGEIRTDTLEVQGPTAFDGITGVPYGFLIGRMRLTYGVQFCPGDGECPAPEPWGYSNWFLVALEQP